MHIQDAQREVRSVYIGGFWGQLVSSIIWLASAALGTWVSPKASILTVCVGGFFIFCAHADDAASVGPPRFREQREFVPFPGDADRLCAAVFDAAPCARRSLRFELVFSGSDGPFGGALFTVRHSLWDAHVPLPCGIPDRRGRRDRTLVFGNVQPGRMDRRAGPIRFRLDWALHRHRRTFRAAFLDRCSGGSPPGRTRPPPQEHAHR